MPNRLTSALQVADRFYVKPLLRTVTFPQTAFVLALAEGSVRLLEVTPDLPTFELRVPDLPESPSDAAGKTSIADRSPARRLQGSEGQKTLVRSYARAVDRALRPVLGGQDIPLILAATEPIDAISRSVNSYPHLAGRSLPGNPEASSDAELGEAAREVLDGIYADRLRGLAGPLRGALDGRPHRSRDQRPRPRCDLRRDRRLSRRHRCHARRNDRRRVRHGLA